MNYLRSLFFILLCGLGGFLLSLSGLSIGWMIGALTVAGLMGMKQDSVKANHIFKANIPTNWVRIGQCIIGINLGQRISLEIIETFQSHWAIILGILLVSILFAMGTGFVLWKMTDADMITCFLSATPGGLSTMPSIAEEEGGNTVMVSIVQMMRLILVLVTVPIVVSAYALNASPVTQVGAESGVANLGWTPVLIISAVLGAQLGKLLRFPAPWIIGGMLGVALLQGAVAAIFHFDIVAWWPSNLMIIAQVMLGASIGSKIDKNMFLGMGKIIPVAFLTTASLILFTFICAFVVSTLTDISFMTAALAFAPGGVAEMSTTAVAVQADSTFVVAVQVLRLILVLLFLPMIIRYSCQKFQPNEEAEAISLNKSNQNG